MNRHELTPCGIFFLAFVFMGATRSPSHAAELPPWHGTYRIEDRTAFEFYAARANFPGAMQVREVKFLISGVDTANPTLHFQNSKAFAFHYDFVIEALGWDIDLWHMPTTPAATPTVLPLI